VNQEDLITRELPGRSLYTAGKEYLYFSGTSYLGMARNEAFTAHLQEGLKLYGSNYSSSRLSNVQLAIFAETENYLAAYTGAEAALTLSSGFMAGQLVVRTLAGTGTFLYGPGTHPALWLEPPTANNLTFEEWVPQLPVLINAASTEKIYILFNSLDPLRAKKHPLNWLPLLWNSGKNITLIVDDSHGFGVTGPEGAGIYQEIALPPNIRKVVISSLGKALGIPGGVVLAEEETIKMLKKSSFFGGGSPVVPAYLYAFLKSPEIYKQARTQLLANIQSFTSQLHNPELFCSFPDYPVFYIAHNQLYQYLLSQDILISHFPYPTPADSPITRVILNSLHTPLDIATLAAAINKFCAENEL
jgi:8-amino-7-oxononanoate synthase